MTVGVNTAWKAKTSQPKATPWEQSATNIAVVGCYSFAPFGGVSMLHPLPPGVARGWHINAPFGGVGSLTFRRICYPPELRTHPQPLPKGGGIARP